MPRVGFRDRMDEIIMKREGVEELWDRLQASARAVAGDELADRGLAASWANFGRTSSNKVGLGLGILTLAMIHGSGYPQSMLFA